MAEFPMDDLVATLGVLVLRRDEKGAFRSAGTLPAWFLTHRPGAARSGEAFDVVDRFPFLEAFLPTAETFWASKSHGRIRSGYWVEASAGGKELPLCASAVVVEGVRCLLIEQVRGDFERIRGVLQKARDHKLDEERSDVLRRQLAEARAAQRALLEAVPGRASRLRSDGTLIEGEALPAEAAEQLLAQGRRAAAGGRPVSFRAAGASGWVSPISDDEFWIVFSDAP